MAGPSLLANMNISPQTVSDLCDAGWNTIRVTRLLRSSAPDAQVLELARNDNRIVITQDLDFSDLLALGGYCQPSVVTIRTSYSDPESITRRLLEVLPKIESDLQQGCCVTVEDTRFRIRRLPI